MHDASYVAKFPEIVCTICTVKYWGATVAFFWLIYL